MEDSNLKRTNWVTLTLPSLRDFDRFLGWMLGRIVFSAWLFTLRTLGTTAKIVLSITEQTERATHQLLNVYSQLPHMGTTVNNVIDTTAIVSTTPDNIITNLLPYIESKHVIIVGDTGTGKSMLAQFLAYSIGGEVKVYDADASPDEWKGLHVIGRRGNFAAIADEMSNDLTELQTRIETRGELGDKALAGMDRVIVAEEFPLLRDEVDISTDWLLKHARRGRKPKVFLIALSQDDSVKAMGIEGEGNVRKCFRMVRLGKFAVTHAKHLKDNQLEQWLRDGKYRCTVDDSPCQLPDLSSYRMLTPQLQPQVASQPTTTLEPPLQPIDSKLKTAVKACIDAGISDSHIIKDVLGYQGSRYQEGKKIFDDIRKS